MAPKMLSPLRHRASRCGCVSPKLMNGVLGLRRSRWSRPCGFRRHRHSPRRRPRWSCRASVELVGDRARADDGAGPSGRVLAACAIRVGKSKVMSTPACGLPNSAPLSVLSSGRLTLPPSQAAPSSSGVTATGEKAEDGLAWKKPKPLPSSPGIRLRRLTSLTSMKSLMCRPPPPPRRPSARRR